MHTMRIEHRRALSGMSSPLRDLVGEGARRRGDSGSERADGHGLGCSTTGCTSSTHGTSAYSNSGVRISYSGGLARRTDASDTRTSTYKYDSHGSTGSLSSCSGDELQCDASDIVGSSETSDSKRKRRA